MNRGNEWRWRMKRAAGWEERETGDPEIESLRKMFRPAAGDRPTVGELDHIIGERVWKSLRPHLPALGKTSLTQAPLWPALAAAGPRFALGSACALLIMAGVFFNQARLAPPLVASRPGPAIILAEATLTEAPPPTPEEYPAQALQTSDGDELLRFIAYSSPSR